MNGNGNGGASNSQSHYNENNLAQSSKKPSAYAHYEDNRPIKGSGSYDISTYSADHEEDENDIMGGTINTMELTSMPVRGGAFKKKDKEAEFDDLKTQEFYDQKLAHQVPNEFPADFEEVESEGEAEDFEDNVGIVTRLTQKKGEKELTEVMDEYMKYISGPDDYKMDNSSHFSEVPSRF